MAARSGASDHERIRRQLEREAKREQAAREREAQKAAKERYLQSRQDEAARRTEEAARALVDLNELLQRSLADPVGPLDLSAAKQSAPILPLHLGVDADPSPAPEWAEYMPSPPGLMGRLLGGVARHERAAALAHERFAEAVERHTRSEADRQRRVEDARGRHAQQQAAAVQRTEEANVAIDRLIAGVETRDRHAVSEYYQRVVDPVRDPPGFPRQRRTAYVPESELLAIEWDLPRMDVVPECGSFRYIKTRDEIDSRPMSIAVRRSTYQGLIAQMALRALRLAFGSDPVGLVDTVVFNGMIDEVDPATGLDVRRCLITLRATRDQVAPLRLDRVKPVSCIRDHFAAKVSEHPEELRAVEPVLEFDMADPRVVDPVDVMSGIDQRPNLLDYTPSDFEHFIQNLFAKMGLKVQVFRPGGDGGIDCVVYDPTPIFGGKFCVQAKLYRSTVPPSAVRDLFGAVGHEGATKGILITTSGFSKATYNWASDKPLQLIDGTGLLAICQAHGIPARILR